MKNKTAWIMALISTIPFLILLLMFLLIPMVWIVISAFQNMDGSWTLAWFNELANNPFYKQALTQSLKISFWPSVVGLFIGLMGAYSLFRVKDSVFGKAMLSFNSVMSNFTGVPLAFAFMIILGSNGVLTILMKMGGMHDVFDIYGLSGLMLVYVYFQVPLAILLLYPAIESLQSEWRESASLMGAGRFAYFRHIAIPILMPAILATFVVLFANALGAYATTYALTTGNFNILPIRIASLIAGNLSLEPNMAAAISVLLMLIMVLTTGLNQWLHRYVGKWT